MHFVKEKCKKFSFIVKFCFILFWENIQTFHEKRNAKKSKKILQII